MSLQPPSDDEMRQVFLMIQQATNPALNLTEAQQAEYEMVGMIKQTFNVDDMLRRIADLSENKDNRTKAEVFGSAVISQMLDLNMVAFRNNVEKLYAIHLVAHSFATFERYLEQGEL